ELPSRRRRQADDLADVGDYPGEHQARAEIVNVSFCSVSLARCLKAAEPVRTDNGNPSSAATPSAPIGSGPRSIQNSSTRPAATKDDATRAPPSTSSLVMPFSASAWSTANRS